MAPCPQGLSPCATPPQRWPGPWQPQCRSASPVASGLARRSGALAPAVALRARRPRSPGPAVRACGAVRSTPTPRSPPLGALRWRAGSALPRAAQCRWSVWSKPMAIGSPPSRTHGRRAPRACDFRPWHSGRRWRRSCPGHASPGCARAAVGRRPVLGGKRSSPRPTSTGWTRRRPTQEHCAGDGALPVWSAGVAAAHRRHHAGRGDPDDPPASAARRGSTCQGSSACPPRSLCVVLRLTSPGVEHIRPRSLRLGGTKHPSSGPPPEIPLALCIILAPPCVLLLAVCSTPRHGSVLYAHKRGHRFLAVRQCPAVAFRIASVCARAFESVS